MDCLKVTAHLRSPLVSAGGYMTLDGLLASRLFDELQDVEAAHAAIPVRQTEGLYHASAAILEPVRERVTFIAGLREAHSLDPDLIKRKKSGELHMKFSSELTNVMNTYDLLTAPTVTWYVEGDADEIRRLLAPVAFIGKRRASGFGEVAEWRFELDEDGTEEPYRFGVEGPFGEPLRPVPVALFRGDTSHPIVDAAWRPAYWNLAHRVACYAPAQG